MGRYSIVCKNRDQFRRALLTLVWLNDNVLGSQRVRRVKPELYQDMTFEKERG